MTFVNSISGLLSVVVWRTCNANVSVPYFQREKRLAGYVWIQIQNCKLKMMQHGIFTKINFLLSIWLLSDSIRNLVKFLREFFAKCHHIIWFIYCMSKYGVSINCSIKDHAVAGISMSATINMIVQYTRTFLLWGNFHPFSISEWMLCSDPLAVKLL